MNAVDIAALKTLEREDQLEITEPEMHIPDLDQAAEVIRLSEVGRRLSRGERPGKGFPWERGYDFATGKRVTEVLQEAVEARKEKNTKRNHVMKILNHEARDLKRKMDEAKATRDVHRFIELVNEASESMTVFLKLTSE